MALMVKLWSGVEVRALREAKRMSIRAFAAHLGVSERMVSKWEAGGEKIHPRPVNQAALDSSLLASGADVQARFSSTVAIFDGQTSDDVQSGPPLLLSGHHQVRHPIDGKLMVFIDAGTHLHGPDNEPVHLPAFYSDVFPTTNADYARFIAATGQRKPQHWDRESGPPDGISDHPVTFVTWHDASAYAQWAAKTLPTSQQWEKAARGVRGDIYPWGSQLTAAKCNVRESGISKTTPVNRYHSGVSSYGAYDMCGNVWEWLSSSSEPDRYELKGGAFTSPFVRATPSSFNDAFSNMMDDDTGFRCVIPAETMRALLKMTG
ncbi:SUMF1/EgtB/PvdO family nonheme iron enzyme [Streptosporangium saharense]|uniref:SUMF1/EgtB/PvdO family nonheme iron enzyme n=1 Tax=Streptosporangium saharense TaxID=1706840 RepID=UPI0036B95FFF